MAMHEKFILLLLFVALFVVQHISSCQPSTLTNTTRNSIPFATRAYWMRVANKVLADLDSPCPLYPFSTVIVNHTASNGLGDLICIAINELSTGNPTLHGEMAAINNCTEILTAKNGSYRLTPGEASDAFSQLSLYTNSESCPMCASAIRWAGFKEYIYGTSIRTLIKEGWNQIRIESHEIFAASGDLGPSTKFIADVLSNETDPYFLWQNNPKYPCPTGCRRTGSGNICKPR